MSAAHRVLRCTNMSDSDEASITLLLDRWREGDRSAERQLFDAIYVELDRKSVV